MARASTKKRQNGIKGIGGSEKKGHLEGRQRGDGEEAEEVKADGCIWPLFLFASFQHQLMLTGC